MFYIVLRCLLFTMCDSGFQLASLTWHSWCHGMIVHDWWCWWFIFIVVKSTDSEWIPDQRYCRDKCKGNIETKNHVFSFNRSTRHLFVRFEICCHICYMLHCKQPRVSAKLSRRKTRSIEPDFFGASLEPQRRGSLMFVPSSSTSEMSRSWLCSQENTNS